MLNFKEIEITLDRKKIIAVIDTPFAVVKRKPEKNQACTGFIFPQFKYDIHIFIISPLPFTGL